MKLEEGLNRDLSRSINVGMFYLPQLFFAKFDMQVHTSESES